MNKNLEGCKFSFTCTAKERLNKMYQINVNDSSLFELLYKIDRDIADEYRQKPCVYCGSVCHFANYYRKARGIDDKYCLRFSVCCSKCRKRQHVPSTLFFSSFVYGSVFCVVDGLFTQPRPQFSPIVRYLRNRRMTQAFKPLYFISN